MLIPFRNERRYLIISRMAKLGIVWFIVALAASSISTIWAVYIDGFVKNASLVGFTTSFLLIVGLISDIFLIPLIEKSKKSSLYIISVISIAICYFLFALYTKFFLFLIIAIIYTIFTTLRITTFGIIVKDKSKRSKLSENEGFLYSLANLSWVIGPLMVGIILIKYKENVIFLMAAGLMLLSFLLFKFLKIKDANVKKKIDKNFIKNIKDFLKDKKVRHCYLLRGGVNIWWSFIYIFIPLLIIRSGLQESWVAYFLFAVPIPLILFEYKFSKIAEKKGFKKIFKTGFLIVAFAGTLCFFMPNIYAILIILILASIGIAMLEPTTESYFFDVCSKEEEQRFYGPYNTSYNLYQSFGQLSAGLILLVLPFKYLFLYFGFLMFLMFLLSFKIKNAVEIRRKG